MVLEAVLQLKKPELHQSQLPLARNPAPSAILDYRGLQDPITGWEASEGGAKSASRAHVAPWPGPSRHLQQEPGPCRAAAAVPRHHPSPSPGD